jgi:hypothetical protein
VTRAETLHISIGAVVGATLILLALLLYGLGIISIPFVTTPPGSPYVRGGSIRGLTNPSWTKCDGTVCKIESGYWTTATHNTQLVLSSVGNGIDSLPGLTGWTVRFYDRNSDGSISQDPAVQLCSGEDCSAGGLDSRNYVFISSPRDPDAFQQHSSGELRYHNRQIKCDNGYSKEGYCDHIVLVGIVQKIGGTIQPEVKYLCGGLFPGRCSVGFPKP